MSFGFLSHKSARIPLACAVLTLLHLDCPAVFAQPPTLPLERPGEERPPLSASREPTLPSLALPPVTPPPGEDRLSTQVRVFVRQFQLTGNTVFADEELAQVTAPYENRRITAEELQEVRHKLTLYYVERGYINSGAVIPDQPVADGVINIQIIEGTLTDIDIGGNKRLRSGYLSNRLALGAGPPLNIQALQQRLQLLQQDPLIARVNAELVPGLKAGEGVLKVQVREETPYQFGLVFANDRPPSVGAERARLYAAHRNLTGWGDSIALWYGLTEGADDVSLAYALPLNAYDTTLTLGFIQSDSTVIEEPFADLDIDSELETYGITLSHPFYRTPQRTFSLGLSLERRHSKTFVQGIPFSFSPGVEDGESTVTVVRFFQEWLDRRLNQVIAVRSTFSLGIDALGATINAGGLPDGRFLAWLGQFQWARRFGERGNQVIFRTDLQLARESLLPLEKFSIGGGTTVRGYRENQLVRDNGWVTSLEFRLPIFRLPLPRISHGPEEGMVQLAPFADFGRSWNTDEPTPDPKTISSIGLGVRWDPSPSIHAQLYGGLALRNIDTAEHDLQDSGIHFALRLFYP